MKKTFGMEDIHHFRVEVKKTRAFLRMLSSNDDTGKIKIPGPLKEAYRKAGKMRDIQLHREDIRNEKKAGIQPGGAYLQQLDNKLEAARKELKSLRPRILPLSRQKIEKKLQGLPSPDIESFTKEKLVAVARIAPAKTIGNEELHLTRKNLKDIIYLSKTFETDLAVPFPYSGWSRNTEKYINALAADLGKLQDSFTALAHLGDPHFPAGAEEKKWLNANRRKHRMIIRKIKQQLKNKYFKNPYPLPGTNPSCNPRQAR